MINNTLIQKLTNLIKPIVEEKNLEFYHLEYVKEAGENYLRIYIDKPEGITLDDCESVSRSISDLLDVQDPIPEAYYLEVSSPGIERVLYTDEHLKRYIGSVVTVKLSKLYNGKKKYEGLLLDFDSNQVKVNTDDTDLSIPKDIISVINLKGEF